MNAAPETADPTPRLMAGGLRTPQFLGLVCLYWLFVTVSNLLYAYGMRAGIGMMTKENVFASWDARLLQHVLLFPLFLAALWGSLRIEWRPLWRAIPLQLLVCGLFAGLAYPALAASLAILQAPEWTLHRGSHKFGDMDPGVFSLWFASFISFIPAYGFAVALLTGFGLYNRFRDTELHVAALEREWSAARLAALRMQLSPHSLFNLLHTIRGLIEWDPKGAQSMVVQLADLLRRLLRAGDRDFSTLADELHIVTLYLELQRRRFPNRLTLQLPEAGGIPAVTVPSLILQPLVENAVLHGMAGHQGMVDIRILARVSGQSLCLQVINTLVGTGDRSAADGGPGIGLDNVRERLAVQFGGRARMLAGPHGGEWRVELYMPALREAPRRAATAVA